jgi:hypothetical protein
MIRPSFEKRQKWLVVPDTRFDYMTPTVCRFWLLTAVPGDGEKLPFQAIFLSEVHGVTMKP